MNRTKCGSKTLFQGVSAILNLTDPYQEFLRNREASNSRPQSFKGIIDNK